MTLPDILRICLWKFACFRTPDSSVIFKLISLSLSLSLSLSEREINRYLILVPNYEEYFSSSETKGLKLFIIVSGE